MTTATNSGAQKSRKLSAKLQSPVEKPAGDFVIGNHQRIKGYSLFLCKEHATELHFLEPDFRDEFLPTQEELDDFQSKEWCGNYRKNKC